jgi:uncharacterized glyoxalase superfamily protein PhnB
MTGRSTLGSMTTWPTPDDQTIGAIGDLLKAYLSGDLPLDEAARKIHALTRNLPIGFSTTAPEARERFNALLTRLRALAGLQIRSVAPQFVVPDVVTAAEYYRDVLGFEVTGYFLDPPVHAIVRRDAAEVFFSKANGEAGTPNARLTPETIDAYFRVSGLDVLVADLQQRGATIVEGPVLRSYGMREITVRDCNEFLLVFGEDAT